MTPLERLFASLAGAPLAVSGILAKWNLLDDDLREHYSTEIEWLLCKVREYIEDHAGEISARPFLLQAERASREFIKLSDAMKEMMGFRPEEILPPCFAAARVHKLAK